MTPQKLLNELSQIGVKLTVVGDKLRYEAPPGVLTPVLKEALRQHKPALVALLTRQQAAQPEGVREEPDYRSRVIRLYRARQACLDAGHCLSLTREVDCQLFPLTWRWGWCRERVPATGPDST